VGFGRANNQLVPLVRGRHVLLLNTDAFVAPETLTRTCDFLGRHSEIGIAGVQLIGEDGVIQPSARFFPTPLNLFLQRTDLDRRVPGVQPIYLPNWQVNAVVDRDWVPGWHYLIPGEVLHKLGLFDPRYFLYNEGVDHCRRIKQAGYQMQCLSDTRDIHLGGASSGSDGPLTAGGQQLLARLNESEVLYLRKHFGLGGLSLHLGLQSVLSVLRWLRAFLRPAGAAVRDITAGGLSVMWSSALATRGGLLPTR
jgi:GT2 family glycosyltransferase